MSNNIFELSAKELTRWLWRQLTSMRTAIMLLLLLVVVSIPGSVLPQRNVDPAAVRAWIEESPTLGEWLFRLGFFNVFSAPWFAAVYILLLVSLVGCILPRSWMHYQEIRSEPPSAPTSFARLAEHQEFKINSDFDSLATSIKNAKQLKSWRIKVDPENKWIAAEKGFARETGNLIFHLALVGLILAVGIGVLFSYRGQILVKEGTSVSTVPTQFNSLTLGTALQVNDLPASTVKLEEFEAKFERGSIQTGSPRSFKATVQVGSADALTTQIIEVNKPLKLDGSKWYLVGHGYAPRVEVRDPAGNIVFTDSVVFLPVDGNFTSEGAIKVPNGDSGLGFVAIFLPTASVSQMSGPRSLFPDIDDPRLFLSAFSGDLGLDDGIPRSVFSLDTENLKPLGIKDLAPGETWELPDGKGTIKFLSIERFVTFDVAKSPGGIYAMIFAFLGLLGLIGGLYIRRRRVWIREMSQGDFEIAALSRYDQPGLDRDVNLFLALCSNTEKEQQK